MNEVNITLQDVHSAAERLKGRLHLTPLFRSTQLGDRLGVELYFKCENLQKTGSFKVRGVLNKMMSLTEEEIKHGVVTVSAGNHAQALAWAARAANTSCKVVMPETAPKSKIAASKGYGAEVILIGDVFKSFDRALEIAEEENRTFVHPFEDELIIAGHGTAGLEIMDQCADADVVVVGIGGGAICTGIALTVKSINPSIRVYGVEPEGANSMRQSLDTGKAVKLEKVDTIADGLGSPLAGTITYNLVKTYVEDVIVVSDKEIARAMGEILSWTKLLAEPAGAAATAALLEGKIPLSKGEKVVSVISGGNIDLDKFCELTAG